MLKKTAEFSGVLNKKIKNSKFKNKHKTNRKYFTRKGKLGFSKIMTMIIKKSNKSIQNSLNDMQLDINDDCTITNSAYTQARAKLNYTAFKEFANDTANFFYQDDEYNKYKGFRILAVDGSVVILPNSDDIKKEFNPTVAKCQVPEFKKEVVQSRVSCLYDVLNGITLDASINNKINSDDNDLIAYDERTLAVEHLPYCTKNDLVVLDRGYPSYEMFVKYAAV
ncbi:MAG: hypothetical protein U9R37_07440, partial [Campylobacterota bacterium]|nr:hypothetical protein [Campylobacterota bacterium]